MSNYRYRFSSIPILLKCDKIIIFIFFLNLSLFVFGTNYLFAADFLSRNYQIIFDNNTLSLSAKKADLKNILSDISKFRGISIHFPSSLEKKVTLKLDEISIREALERLLKDFNYSIIYSGSKKQAVISDIFIFKQTRKATRTNANDNRINSRIKSYERRIESLKNSLLKVEENSTRGRSYLNRIKSYEKNIERLKNQLN